MFRALIRPGKRQCTVRLDLFQTLLSRRPRELSAGRFSGNEFGHGAREPSELLARFLFSYPVACTLIYRPVRLTHTHFCALVLFELLRWTFREIGDEARCGACPKIRE